jgi:fumarate reductase subunit D
MKDKVAIGIFLGLVYFGFIMLIPHLYPMTQEIETDFINTFIVQAQELHTWITGEKHGDMYDYFETQSWKYHGLPYPLILNAAAYFFEKDKPVKGWQFFKAGKVVSAIAGGLLIMLIVVLLPINMGWVVAVVIGTHASLFNYSYSCSSDIVALSLVAWGSYFTVQGVRFQIKRKWYWMVLGSVIYSAGVGVRHEYIAFLPVLLLLLFPPFAMYKAFLKPAFILKNQYLREFTKRIILFLIPFLLIVGLDSRSWTTHCLVPFKYLNDGEAFDRFPPQMFEEAKMDTIDNYYIYQNEVAEKYYPTYFSVIKADPSKFFKVLTRDIFRGIEHIITTSFLCFAFILIFLRVEFGKNVYLKSFLAAMILHFGVTISFGLFEPRYFLLEMFAIIALGVWGFLKFLKGLWADGRRPIVIGIAVLLPVLYGNVKGLNDQIDHNQFISGEKFAPYKEYTTAFRMLRGETPTIMTTKAQCSFITGSKWQPFPPQLRDVYSYCMRYDVDFVLWTGFEQHHRPEWRDKFDDPRNAIPEFVILDHEPVNGLLYLVNTADSVRTKYESNVSAP